MLQLLTKPYLGGCLGWDWLLSISLGLAGSHYTQLLASLLQSRLLTSLAFFFARIPANLKMG